MACLVDGTLKVETLMSAAVPNHKLTCVYAVKLTDFETKATNTSHEQHHPQKNQLS